MGFKIKNDILIQYINDDNAEVVVVPDGIRKIGDYAFFVHNSIKKIVLPETAECIGKCAFKDCSFLTDINIPDSVHKFSTYSFAFCHSLKSINIPEGVKKIPMDCFDGLRNITELHLPSTLVEIAEAAFESCRAIGEVIIPNGVKKIGFRAFNGCYSLTKIVIPESIEIIEDEAITRAVINNKLIKVEIIGIKGSAAEEYALKNDCIFTAANNEVKYYGRNC